LKLTDLLKHLIFVACAAVFCGMWVIPEAIQGAEDPPEGGQVRPQEEIRRLIDDVLQSGNREEMRRRIGEFLQGRDPEEIRQGIRDFLQGASPEEIRQRIDEFLQGRNGEEIQRRIDEFIQRGREQLKKTLGVTDEEWQIIGPRIEAVQKAEWNLDGGAGLLGRLGGNRMGGFSNLIQRFAGNQAAETEVGKKMTALRQLLEKENPNPAEIKTALDALRTARQQAKKDLAVAREKLREVLTHRQEAMLVMLEILD